MTETSTRRPRGYQEVRVSDPRDPDGEATLVVALDVTAHAVVPHGRGEHYDPGSVAEFTVRAVYDELGDRVGLPAVYAQQVEAYARVVLEGG